MDSVYLVGGSGARLLFGVDAGSGSIVWQQSKNRLERNGSTPAVTRRESYIAEPLQYRRIRADNRRQLFAEQHRMRAVAAAPPLWSRTMCSIRCWATRRNGIYVNATTGVQLGTFTADGAGDHSTRDFFLQSGR